MECITFAERKATMGFRFRNCLVLLVAVAALGATSCRRAGPEPVYPVTGNVLYQGKPAEWARVTLVSTDGRDPQKPKPGAQVAGDGEFRLSTYASYDGAPAGRYAVTVMWPSPERKENGENAGPDLLQGRYADPQTTPLSVEIKKGDNHLEPFNLQ
jgi:hypothetical protein